jgi:RimJ/RimL family protein N-acetyltransferase
MNPPVLENRFVRLEALSLEHVEPLLAAASRDRSTFDLASVPSDGPTMRAYVEQAIEESRARRSVPYAVRRISEGDVVGSTRLMNLEWWSWPVGRPVPAGEPRRKDAGDPPDVAEIGHVWLAKDAQRTAVNTAASLLLMTHAFDTWNVHRLFLKTDARNERSRAMILRLGASFEGILRAHMPSADGRVRDTAMFAIVAAEWPRVRERLASMLRPPEHGRS